MSAISPATVIELLDDVRTDGLAPSFNANNLTAQVIENCSVAYTPSKTCKEAVCAFLEKLIAISPESTALPEDAFFYMN